VTQNRNETGSPRPVKPSWLEMTIHTHIWKVDFDQAYQTDLVFDLWSEFIIRSAHARLQVCVQRLRFEPLL